MQHTLVAVFDNRSDAQSAMDELLASGFTRDNVNVSSADLAAGSSATTAATTTATAQEEGVGASIKNFFESLFGTDHDQHAIRYSNAVTSGRHVLTLTTTSEPEVERAADVIERFGPIDIDERHDLAGNAATLGASAYQGAPSASLQSGSQSGSQPGNLAGSRAESADLRTDSQQREATAMQTGKAAIPVVQEEVHVGKRLVERGGVRVFSRVVETPVNETVALREEHVSVERRPVDRPIDPADAAAFKDKTIDLRETAEEAVVQKSARVVEEVVVGKEVSQREQQISDTVRRTQVDVQPLQGAARDDDTYYRNDWQQNYASLGGTYDDYAPAYRYGYDMRRDARYQGRNWDDVESSLRSDWDARYGSAGASTWERMKAAVRSGWNRMTS
ncbi:YsnF/AvaK domain-containing protein [Massilia sp. TW-1]|uniref:YsnF/AvaK domain-containing protein n=1 Tax=Telluria antibiotica TaxID=2717319 RepID=A0ABX0P549_9BURK|nr:YsnF/AvaK domain-containing protein [Telluria antibiotica]NIA52061.1 YsnF/AvaK domain-containing protein [Telluria antibiotica]